MTWQSAICFSLLVCCLGSFPGAATGGTVSGRVTIVAAADQAARKKKDFGEIVVWLQPPNGRSVLRPTRHARMLQKDKLFTPHVLAIETGTTVDFPNLDPIFHNAFSNFDGQIFDLALYAPGSSRAVQFNRPGVVRIFCNIHPSMSAVIVVVASNYFGSTAPDGSFVIPDVPPGAYEIHFFDERATPETLQLLTKSISVPEPAISLPPTPISEAAYLPAAHKNKYGRDYPAISEESPGGYGNPIK